jgi:hypothetical protein
MIEVTMTRRVKAASLLAMSILAAAGTASANPLVSRGMGVGSLVALLGFPLEAWLIAWQAKASVIRPRFVLAWIPTTVLTFAGMMWLVSAVQPSLGYLLAILLSEVLVVVVEGFCIQAMLGHSFFVISPGRRPSLGVALRYSLIANLGSLVWALVVTYLSSLI